LERAMASSAVKPAAVSLGEIVILLLDGVLSRTRDSELCVLPGIFLCMRSWPIRCCRRLQASTHSKCWKMCVLVNVEACCFGELFGGCDWREKRLVLEVPPKMRKGYSFYKMVC
jgi:hypothetical protein